MSQQTPSSWISLDQWYENDQIARMKFKEACDRHHRYCQIIHKEFEENMGKVNQDSEELKFLRKLLEDLEKGINSLGYNDVEPELLDVRLKLLKRIQEVEMRDWNL